MSSEPEYCADDDQAAADARHADRLTCVSAFASGIVHDINNALMFYYALDSKIEMLQHKLKKVLEHPRIHSELFETELARCLDYTGGLKKVADDGNSKIDEILDHLKPLALKDFDARLTTQAATCVSNAFTYMHRDLKEKIPVMIDIPENLPPIRVNPPQISLILNHIITYFQRTILARGTVGILDLRVRERGQRLAFTVENREPVLEETDANKLFEPDAWSSSNDKRMALQLSMSRIMIRHHQGHLTVEPIPGQGNRFTIDLPVDRATCKAPDQSGEQMP